MLIEKCLVLMIIKIYIIYWESPKSGKPSPWAQFTGDFLRGGRLSPCPLKGPTSHLKVQTQDNFGGRLMLLPG